ncbi:MAG TPA: GRP family sugar transporter [Acidobacteriaceae bacterium]|nr:GRP family sugar transporter [Acidobacteriaceae bacterium]
MHGLGIACAIAAGAWLGAAEAPAKLVSAGFSPFSISLCMVLGVFVARWTLPILFKGTSSVVQDLATRPHLIVWAVMAGCLWAVANTLTIFAIRDVGLSIAFPLWNTNSLVGLFWGWFLFRELEGASPATWIKVLGGAVTIVGGAILLSSASVQAGAASPGRAAAGVIAALAAGLMWGTMYVPYRKAYLTGMNPLSFVTVFTFGELGTMALLAAALHGKDGSLSAELHALRPSMLWLFLGGFFWVIGDIFQQYATKYIGISRAIPLSNTNQLWGLAWGALVFSEFARASRSQQILVFTASAIMILGALAIASASAQRGERDSCMQAIRRECSRYRIDLETTLRAQGGAEASGRSEKRPWWDLLILAAAAAIFVWLALGVRLPPLKMNFAFTAGLTVILLLLLFGCGRMLWKRTRFA